MGTRETGRHPTDLAFLGRDEPVQARARTHGLNLRRAGDLRKERCQWVLAGHAGAGSNEKAEPLLVMHGLTDRLLLSQELDCNLPQLATAQLLVERAQRELRGNAHRFVNLPEQPCGLFDIGINMINKAM